MSVVRNTTMAVVLLLWGSTAWGTTLTWDANTEPDLAGYRVYQCSQQPCGRAFGTATSLVTLGTVTSFNIGTPAAVRFYVITAYDFANNESNESNVAAYNPIAAPPPTSADSPGVGTGSTTCIVQYFEGVVVEGVAAEVVGDGAGEVCGTSDQESVSPYSRSGPVYGG